MGNDSPIMPPSNGMNGRSNMVVENGENDVTLKISHQFSSQSAPNLANLQQRDKRKRETVNTDATSTVSLASWRTCPTKDSTDASKRLKSEHTDDDGDVRIVSEAVETPEKKETPEEKAIARCTGDKFLFAEDLNTTTGIKLFHAWTWEEVHRKIIRGKCSKKRPYCNLYEHRVAPNNPKYKNLKLSNFKSQNLIFLRS